MIRSDYYVYIITDQREKWSKTYNIGGVEISPSHKPILIGKGTGDRLHVHVLEVVNKGTHQNPLFLNYVKKMVRECNLPTTATNYLFNGLDEKTAEDLETEAIKVIKRKCDGGPLLNISPGGDRGPKFEELSEEGKAKQIEARRKGGSIGGKKTICNARKHIDPEKARRANSKNGKIWGPITCRENFKIRYLSKEQLAEVGRNNLKKVSKETLAENGRNAMRKLPREVRVSNGKKSVGIMNQKKDLKYLQSIERLISYKDMILNWRDVEKWSYKLIAFRLNEMGVERQGFKGKIHTKGSVGMLIKQFREYQTQEAIK